MRHLWIASLTFVHVCCRHLDAEEAVVLGAGLFAANMSTTFKLRKFRMSDGATYPVVFQVTNGAASWSSMPMFCVWADARRRVATRLETRQ